MAIYGIVKTTGGSRSVGLLRYLNTTGDRGLLGHIKDYW